MGRWIFPHSPVTRSLEESPSCRILPDSNAPRGSTPSCLRRGVGPGMADLLAWLVLLLGASGQTPTEIAAILFCARSSVYRSVRA